MKATTLRAACGVALTLALISSLGVGVAAAVIPDHPVITEVFPNAPGTDGPIGRLPSNLHQEFIEIYLPTAADLRPGLNKDALRLTFYEIEGDDGSPGTNFANYRIDLPTFDLDPSNGTTFGAIPRPSSGVVVMGWVDYADGIPGVPPVPPTGLTGTASTRLALVNGGITSAVDFTFVAVNGEQFGPGQTLNFAVPAAFSLLDLTNDPFNGWMEQGSAAYLLVNRDDPGYAEVCAVNDVGCAAPLFLNSNTPLAVSSLLDGFAANDGKKFKPDLQPTQAGKGVDLDFVLTLGGAFSSLVPQVPEDLEGYARLFVDIVKTTEDGIPGNENPALDYLQYRTVSALGAVGPTPGSVHFMASPAELQALDFSLQVLTNTTARAGAVAANVGGDFGMTVTTTPGVTSDPAQMVLSGATTAFGPVGQVPIAPDFQVQTFANTADGRVETVSIQVDASALPGDPAAVNPNQGVTATITAINPTTGLNLAGQPFQATTFLAVQGLPDQIGVANEFAATSLGQFVAANLGGLVQDDRGRGLTLVNPATDLSNAALLFAPFPNGLVSDLPVLPAKFINLPGPVGKPDLVATVLGSAEHLSGSGTYDASLNASQTLVQAREFTIPETRTWGGTFTPSEEVHFADAKGNPGVVGSGLSNVITGRGFELAILDTNLRSNGSVESGATDDFGLVVEVGQTSPGASVVPGEWVFLSFSGGLQGADIDTVDVPPHGNLTNILYLDMDPLHSVLGVDTITRLVVVDGSGGSEVNPMEVFTLVPEPGRLLAQFAAGAALLLLGRRGRGRSLSC